MLYFNSKMEAVIQKMLKVEEHIAKRKKEINFMNSSLRNIQEICKYY